ncbi:MAG TPA: C45 family peptidase [Terriglobales bacterium]|nr:C45 family peptidase [Terriglobales bacterium]
MRYSIRVSLPIAVWFSIVATTAAGETVARCGEGWLEIIDHYPVLHLKGTPYEMGYQHGALLKESVRENLNNVLNNDKVKSVQVKGVTLSPRWVIDILPAMQISYTPSWYQEELKGLAAGSGLELSEVQATNFLPELFHCSGFAVMNGATTDGTMYHGRILDYACDWHLQDHAVLIIEEPTDGIPFANVTFAGFIGSVTGMNAQHVSIGEMGGGGQGHWAGTPMAVLMREVLQQASNLDEAVSIFRNAQRTCEYYYVIADGNTNRALGIQATWDHLETIEPGKFHERLDKPVKDCVLLSAGGRYTELARRAAEDYGKLNADMARHLMDSPVAGRANLHNVLFEPASTKMWIANASSDGKPAADQKYHDFQLSDLLKHRPDDHAKVISLDPQ